MAITKIVTAQWLKDRYLVGIDLTTDDGEEYPTGHYMQAIDSAVASLEALYDIQLRRSREFTYSEKVDSNFFDAQTWYLTLSEHRPLREIISFKVQFGAHPATTIPTSWVQIMSSQAGQIQVVPGPEAFKLPFMSGGVPFLGFDAIGGRGYVPGWVRIRYKSGFEYDLPGTVSAAAGGRTVTFAPTAVDDDAIQNLRVGAYVGVAGEIHRVADVLSSTSFEVTEDIAATWTTEACVVYDYDPALLDAVGITASLALLDTAGDLIIGAGISNQSISVDGLSQSIGTTSGVENSGYGARAAQYRKRLDDIHHAIRRRYRRMQFFAI